MNDNIHGGDIYRNKVNTDFSISVNPLGVPENVKKALEDSLNDVSKYPDIRCEGLTKATAKMLGVNEDYLAFGNGSSDLFMAIAHAFMPGNVIIPVPSFYGYEYAFAAESENVVFYEMKEEDGFLPTREILDVLNDDIDFLILTNPGNPLGALMDKNLLKDIIDTCFKRNIKVVLDECFVEFTGKNNSVIDMINDYPNLCIIRSFTKIYAIPSVRVGYMICSDTDFVGFVKNHLSEWNVSGIAQAAGVACTECEDYVTKSVEFVSNEREYFYCEFERIGIKYFKSDCNYILIKDSRKLDVELQKSNVMIRNCGNFRGLGKEYYRVAVRTHEENETLIKLLDKIKA